METTDEKITRLTAFWYEYVNLDHHKDRDCHFYIEKHWAYGDPPTYAAHHEGYIAERWFGPKRKTHGEAQYDLLEFLEGEVASAIKRASEQGDEDDFGWGWSAEDKRRVLLLAEEHGVP